MAVPATISPMKMPPPQAVRPNVNINLPKIKKFRGKDDDAHGIIDFIGRIEKNANYEFPEDDDSKKESQISTFCTYLGGEAKMYWGMLSRDDRGSWEKVKAVYIKRFKT